MNTFNTVQKNTTKRRSSVFAAAAVILSLVLLLSGCNITELFSLELPPSDITQAEEGEQVVFDGMKVAVYTGEALDPYTSANRSNRAIMALCYDTLIALDSSFSPYSLISEWTIDGEKVTFVLSDDAVFSDGSRITAADCIYSFDRAAAKGSVFTSRFEKIKKYYADTTYVFTVVFEDEARFNINLLNIPIVKAGGKVGGQYVGSGRYYYSIEDGEKKLRGRVDGRYADDYEFTRIDLFETDDPSELTYYFNYGKVLAAYADLSLGTVRYKGNVELVSFPTLDFVFAVPNADKEYLSDPEVIKAVSYAIDRKGLCAEVFDGLALATWHPFCPGWIKTEEAALSEDIYSVQTANSLLIDNGIGFVGTKRSWKKKEIVLEIICNSESATKCEAAKYFAKNLESIGFSTNVTVLTWSNYVEAIQNGDFDFYLGETVLSPDMDVNGILAPSICRNNRSYEEDQYGISDLDRLKALTDDFLAGNADMRTVVAEFFECQPYIPLYYTEGALAINRVVDGDFKPSETNIYNLIETWTGK